MSKSSAASELSKARWKATPKAERSKYGKIAAAGRMKALSAKRRSEIASIASNSITTEQRKASAAKAWATRRRNAAKKK